MPPPSPPSPPLSPPLRLALISDIPRIALVAVSGFYYSNLGSWCRQHHHAYPLDTFTGYASKFASAVRDPACVVVVAEDAWVSDEGGKTGASVVPDRVMREPEQGGTVVVGVGVWKLQGSSERMGQWMDEGDDGEVFEKGLERDMSALHVERLDPPAYAAGDRHFAGMQTLEMMVVHPAYAGRGHGARLVGWGLELARMDGVNQGVLSSRMGKRLYLRMGYVQVDSVVARDDEEPPNETECAVLVHEGGRGGR
ncbi:MAG: hypothetical protein M1828_001649 [Chrysothrix sp. TS-e1954]|nr:MAG: hypothetical protein M1828_001649 [Chrysothrix sp. TS-e1954]